MTKETADQVVDDVLDGEQSTFVARVPVGDEYGVFMRMEFGDRLHVASDSVCQRCPGHRVLSGQLYIPLSASSRTMYGVSFY